MFQWLTHKGRKPDNFFKGENNDDKINRAINWFSQHQDVFSRSTGENFSILTLPQPDGTKRLAIPIYTDIANAQYEILDSQDVIEINTSTILEMIRDENTKFVDDVLINPDSDGIILHTDTFRAEAYRIKANNKVKYASIDTLPADFQKESLQFFDKKQFIRKSYLFLMNNDNDISLVLNIDTNDKNVQHNMTNEYIDTVYAKYRAQINLPLDVMYDEPRIGVEPIYVR